MSDKGILTSIFAFTPIKGTAKEADPKPSLERYRILQLSNYLISKKLMAINNFRFDEQDAIKGINVNKTVLDGLLVDGAPFQTFGCEGCNRPYYNEPVSGPIYNYPRKLAEKELEEIKVFILKSLTLE